MATASKVTADIAGQFNPAALANRVLFVGPALHGGLQEGLRSYAAGNPWSTIGIYAASETASGVVGGALKTPKALAQVAANWPTPSSQEQ